MLSVWIEHLAMCMVVDLCVYTMPSRTGFVCVYDIIKNMCEGSRQVVFEGMDGWFSYAGRKVFTPKKVFCVVYGSGKRARNLLSQVPYGLPEHQLLFRSNDPARRATELSGAWFVRVCVILNITQEYHYNSIQTLKIACTIMHTGFLHIKSRRAYHQVETDRIWITWMRGVTSDYTISCAPCGNRVVLEWG